MRLVSPLWKRLDTPGHDACVVEKVADGWRLRGGCVFAGATGPASLFYRVDCGPDWITRRARVHGSLGNQDVETEIIRSGDVWTLDGKRASNLEGCLDVDFGFSPATNFLQLRREAMAVGDRRDFDVAWWAFGELVRLPQIYERRTETTYQYDSPKDGYSAVLETNADGFSIHYPTLWQSDAEPALEDADEPYTAGVSN